MKSLYSLRESKESSKNFLLINISSLLKNQGDFYVKVSYVKKYITRHLYQILDFLNNCILLG